MTDFDTLFDATNNESGIIIFPNNDVIIGNWTYSGHGVPRLSPFGDTLVSTGTIDKAEDKGLVNIKDYLTGLDGFDITQALLDAGYDLVCETGILGSGGGYVRGRISTPATPGKPIL